MILLSFSKALAFLKVCLLVFWLDLAVADLEGVQGVRSNPPLKRNYFFFMGNSMRFCMK